MTHAPMGGIAGRFTSAWWAVPFHWSLTTAIEGSVLATKAVGTQGSGNTRQWEHKAVGTQGKGSVAHVLEQPELVHLSQNPADRVIDLGLRDLTAFGGGLHLTTTRGDQGHHVGG